VKGLCALGGGWFGNTTNVVFVGDIVVDPNVADFLIGIDVVVAVGFPPTFPMLLLLLVRDDIQKSRKI